ncbi:Lipoyl synthase [Candidatus Providencia siddallii]|uniref:Lipoyl synthase n=1 Tax=Candidatus Providencia siddallii TaxID=1715285 RepID=A0A0M6W976_9GAMM|nr:Lipoyl synthase [Candidatus Providencia siddallii]
MNNLKFIRHKINIDKIEQNKFLNKPDWIKIKLPQNSVNIQNVKSIIKKNGLYSVCEEALCPNISKCFNRKIATFIILGKICTRRCKFCNIAYGHPYAPDINEPKKLAQVIKELSLKYVVITSVNRDDIDDGGAKHFVNCITEIRKNNLLTKIEILVPDFKRCGDLALNILSMAPPDVFDHNIESVPRIYREIRPGANYYWSLKLLEKFKKLNPGVQTKSGIMVGLGETNKELIEVMHDLRNHGVTILTIGQYLQPSCNNLPVRRYVSISEFDSIKKEAISIGFTYVACGPFIRSSYNADLQEKGQDVFI